MRYPASEKLEIIRIVEQSHLPARRTLEQLGIPRRTFCRWYDRYLDGGPEALADRPSAPSRVWNRIPPDIHDQIIEMALEQSELSPRELAVRFTDEKHYFVSEATVYRLLKAHDLITSPAYVVIKAADRFHTQTARPNEIRPRFAFSSTLSSLEAANTSSQFAGVSDRRATACRLARSQIRRFKDGSHLTFCGDLRAFGFTAFFMWTKL